MTSTAAPQNEFYEHKTDDFLPQVIPFNIFSHSLTPSKVPQQRKTMRNYVSFLTVILDEWEAVLSFSFLPHFSMGTIS